MITDTQSDTDWVAVIKKIVEEEIESQHGSDPPQPTAAVLHARGPVALFDSGKADRYSRS